MVVPIFAKSAATLMALGADEIIMGPQSELGPLDLPMEHPTAEGIRISALDEVTPLENLASVAIEGAYRLGGIIRRDIGLGRKDSIEIALHFFAQYVAPVISKLDPSIVSQCRRELDTAKRYGQEFLAMYMFKGNSEKEADTKRISRTLVWDYPTHSFAISADEARKLGLKVCDSHEYKYWNKLWKLYLGLKDATEEFICLLDEAGLEAALSRLYNESDEICEKKGEEEQE